MPRPQGDAGQRDAQEAVPTSVASESVADRCTWIERDDEVDGGLAEHRPSAEVAPHVENAEATYFKVAREERRAKADQFFRGSANLDRIVSDEAMATR